MNTYTLTDNITTIILESEDRLEAIKSAVEDFNLNQDNIEIIFDSEEELKQQYSKEVNKILGVIRLLYYT